MSNYLRNSDIQLGFSNFKRIVWLKDSSEPHQTDAMNKVEKDIQNKTWELDKLIDYMADYNFDFGGIEIRNPSVSVANCKIAFTRDEKNIPEMKSVFDDEEFAFADGVILYAENYIVQID